MSSRSAGAALVALVAATVLTLPAAAAPVDARAAVSPARVAVGDVFTYTLEVDGTRQLFAEDAVLSTGPFRALGPPRVERDSDRGRVRIVQLLMCASAACVPRDGPRRLRVPAARLGDVAVPAVEVVVRPRASEAAVRGGARAYLRETRLPAVDARVGPRTTTWALSAVAVAAGLAAAGVAVAGRPWKRRRRAAALERAIMLLHESARRSAADRRRAGDLLARVHPAAGLADDATWFAWSEREPTGGDAEALAARASEAAR
jgi:hypothetical protein